VNVEEIKNLKETYGKQKKHEEAKTKCLNKETKMG